MCSELLECAAHAGSGLGALDACDKLCGEAGGGFTGVMEACWEEGGGGAGPGGGAGGEAEAEAGGGETG